MTFGIDGCFFLKIEKFLLFGKSLKQRLSFSFY